MKAEHLVRVFEPVIRLHQAHRISSASFLSPAVLSFIAASASLRSDQLISRRIPTGQDPQQQSLRFFLTISHLLECRYPLSNRVSSSVASRRSQSRGSFYLA
ncbi:hypothetical protein SCLCIDRAFT_700976 [Scleroderma citrinum Foug A]|uniref:Uncharacterized protein n=1 Tax=Scleroderma citrinum Foug A TaxID=1036808 RepID=A0A0C3EMI3_9AGAM|nr:hypothetical protein SCLCIDRAFT_700976 [Scleroderma citrinum Foug A]